MTDELLEENVKQDENLETQNVADGDAALATATEENQSKNDDSEKAHAQDKAQKAINKQHAKYREEERKRVATEKKLEEANQRLAELEAKDGEIVIPTLPDPYDEDYEEKMRLRDEAIMQKASQDANKQSALDMQTANEKAAKEAEQERVNNLVKDYDTRTVQLGLNAGEIAKAGDTVVEYGIYSDVAEFILKHEDGPYITKYLADNLIELDDLRNMTSIEAAMHINSVIAPNAAKLLKPQASDAPDPVETLQGRGVGEQESPLIAGATFE